MEMRNWFIGSVVALIAVLASSSVAVAQEAVAGVNGVPQRPPTLYQKLEKMGPGGPAPRRDASSETLQSQRSRLLPLTALASLSGRPQITLPLLEADGAPVGFSLLGWQNGDEALLEIAQLLAPSC